MEERLQKILSARGVASRRKAEELIARGLVTVNESRQRWATRADPERDINTVEETGLPEKEVLSTLMLNIPGGISPPMSDEKGRTHGGGSHKKTWEQGCTPWEDWTGIPRGSSS
jgi:23S rRNA pseudouridine2605 synthase